MKSYFTIILSFLIILGCETNHKFTQTINNSSSKKITFYFSGESLFHYPDSIVLNPNTTKIAYTFNTIGAQKEGVGCAMKQGEVQAVVNGGFQLTKDITIESNWKQHITGKRNVIEECSFKIREEDIE